MTSLPNDVTDASVLGHRAKVVPMVRPNVDDVVREFESAADVLGIPRPSSPELGDMYHNVSGITAELFPGETRVTIENDPEIPDDLYFVFGVDAIGGIDDIAARNDEWHGRICHMPSKFSGLFRLSVTVR